MSRIGTVEAVSRPRGMRLGTLMIVIAIVAVGFSAVTLNQFILLERIESALGCLAGATVAMVAYRLYPPHPPIGRLLAVGDRDGADGDEESDPRPLGSASPR